MPTPMRVVTNPNHPRIVEAFCHAPLDPAASTLRATFTCGVTGNLCTKDNREKSDISDPQLNGPLGICALSTSMDKRSTIGRFENTIICPIRIYEDKYTHIKSLVNEIYSASGSHYLSILMYDEWKTLGMPDAIVIIGKGIGKEFSIKEIGSIDWIAVEYKSGKAFRFCSIEIQAIDIIGNYRDARKDILKGSVKISKSSHGFNWENVNKRIIPQVVRKGSYFSQISSTQFLGIGLIVDANVFDAIQQRLVPGLTPSPKPNLFVRGYALENPTHGRINKLHLIQSIDTDISKLVLGFTTPALANSTQITSSLNSALK